MFEGKVALVTGAGSGVGLAIASQLLAGGAKVVLHYRSSKDGVDTLTTKYGEERCYSVQADFTITASAEDVFRAVWSWEQRIDILVNNAALIEPVGSVDEIGEKDLTRMMQVNFMAPFVLTKMVISQMRQARSGRVVSISSIGVKYAGSPQTAHYMASKAALEAGMMALAKAAAPEGVLVNVIRAGVIRTEAHQRLGRHDLASREALIPLGRAAEPHEIAEVVLFLVSPLNTYITGVILPVAGGE
jgi:3-oxoacyl-[acyl-carrier protein] reductase